MEFKRKQGTVSLSSLTTLSQFSHKRTRFVAPNLLWSKTIGTIVALSLSVCSKLIAYYLILIDMDTIVQLHRRRCPCQQDDLSDVLVVLEQVLARQ